MSNRKIDAIKVYINDKFLGLAKMNFKRLDVFENLPQYKKLDSGFTIEGYCNDLDINTTIRIEVYSTDEMLGKRVYKLKKFITDQ